MKYWRKTAVDPAEGTKPIGAFETSEHLNILLPTDKWNVSSPRQQLCWNRITTTRQAHLLATRCGNWRMSVGGAFSVVRPHSQTSTPRRNTGCCLLPAASDAITYVHIYTNGRCRQQHQSIREYTHIYTQVQ